MYFEPREENKFSHPLSCQESNLQPSNHDSGAVPLSYHCFCPNILLNLLCVLNLEKKIHFPTLSCQELNLQPSNHDSSTVSELSLFFVLINEYSFELFMCFEPGEENKFFHPLSCRESNLQPSNHDSGAIPQLSLFLS